MSQGLSVREQCGVCIRVAMAELTFASHNMIKCNGSKPFDSVVCIVLTSDC